MPADARQVRNQSLLWGEPLPAGLGQIEGLFIVDDFRHIDEIVEHPGLSSPEVLADLFELEMEAVTRQLPGKQFLKVLL
jgi:predicted Rossmann fold nucleotide-binding protein DprA/Smf involved in DNA uptake